jgi:succinate dehydrogenase/fumarate reductase flavoprotein subunit
MAIFTILFGTRNLDANEHNPGVVAAIAFEALIKLFALLAVGLFVVFGMAGGIGPRPAVEDGVYTGELAAPFCYGEGKRIAIELGRRDYVTGEMWKNKPPFRLCLNKAASDEIIWHCKHYTGRGVMKYYASGADLAKDMGIPVSTLEASHEGHYQAAKKTEKDPDGGSWPAYPSGKSWDEPSGKTGSGKKFYHNIIPGSAVKTEPFYVAIITPVIHYCMGGLEVDVNSMVLGEGNKPIAGLYAAGEIAGGIHGNNRLGGNSLLDCVVFGRVAGRSAARHFSQQNIKYV